MRRSLWMTYGRIGITVQGRQNKVGITFINIIRSDCKISSAYGCDACGCSREYNFLVVVLKQVSPAICPVKPRKHTSVLKNYRIL